MSIERALRDVIREEIEAQIRPLRDLVDRLAPLGSLLGGGGRVGRRAAGPGRRRGSNDRPCALQGCRRPARSKGYCAAHYQKYRNLSRSGRLPPDWVEYAEPDSVKDIVLPRGRAAAKAKAAAKGK